MVTVKLVLKGGDTSIILQDVVTCWSFQSVCGYVSPSHVCHLDLSLAGICCIVIRLFRSLLSSVTFCFYDIFNYLVLTVSHLKHVYFEVSVLKQLASDSSSGPLLTLVSIKPDEAFKWGSCTPWTFQWKYH